MLSLSADFCCSECTVFYVKIDICISSNAIGGGNEKEAERLGLNSNRIKFGRLNTALPLYYTIFYETHIGKFLRTV